MPMQRKGWWGNSMLVRVKVAAFLCVAVVMASVSSVVVAGDADDEGFGDFEDEFQTADATSVSDPLIRYNRLMFAVNDKAYFWVLKPVARTYAKLAPERCRVCVRRCFRNVAFPVRAVNNLLQGKIRRSGVECVRFGINTTVGVLGLFDPAEEHWGLAPYGEDCGQTLGHYGVGSGWPLVLPLFGPSNLRDAVGKVPDFFLDPIAYLDSAGLRLGLRSTHQINETSLRIGDYEGLKKASLDPYLFLRNAYEQNRVKAVSE